MASSTTILQDIIWKGSLPLEIRLSPGECRIYDKADPYLIQFPRLSYLPFLLPRLHAFFSPFLIDPDLPQHCGWFSFEEIPLKWHYPLGLLFDLFSGAAPSGSPTTTTTTTTTTTGTGTGTEAGGDTGGGGGGRNNNNNINHNNNHNNNQKEEGGEEEEGLLPWRLLLHFSEWPDEQLVRLDSEGKVLHDAFINSVKEADFLRNGTAKGIMSLSKDDSTRLWHAVEEQNFALFSPISQKLLYAQGTPLRHIPLKIYLPSSSSSSSSSSPPSAANEGSSSSPTRPVSGGHLRVVQSLITPTASSATREAQTLGSALHILLPALFPSRRTPILAKPVLHGCVVPMGAPVEELLRNAAYLDGWLHLGVVMNI